MRDKAIILAALAALLVTSAAALDINSSKSFQYYGNGNTLDFEIATDGQINAQDNLTLGGNSIENLNGLYSDTSGGNFFASACTGGQVIEQINADGSYSCVDPTEDTSTEGLNATLEAGSIANQTLFMNGNNIDNPGQVDGVEIESPGNAIEVSSNSYAVSSNSIDTSELASSAVTNTELGTGSVNNDSIASFNTFTLQTLDLTNNLQGSSIVNSGQISSGAVGGSELASDAVTNDSIDNSATVMLNGGTMTGELDMNQNDFQDVANIYADDGTTNFFGSCSGSKVIDSISSDGSINCVTVSTEAEGLNATLLEGDIANQSIRMNGNDLVNPGQVDGVEIENPGNAIEVSSNSYAVSSNSIDTSELASGAVTNTELGSGAVNNDSVASFNTFTMQTLDLTNNLQGSNIVNSGQISSGAVGSSELATDAVTNDSVDNSATFMVNGGTMTGELDMNQNDFQDVANIYSDDGTTNFFGSCSSGQVIDSISSNGNINCVDPAEDIASETLNETLLAGDIANQSIRMDGNDLVNPGQVDNVDLDNPGNALEVSGSQYAVSSNSIDTGEIASSAVTNTEIASGAVNNDSVASFNTFTVQTLDLTSDLQGSSIVNSDQISSGAVGSSELASDAVNNDSIDNTATVMVNGATLNSDLDMNQNDLTDVSRIEGDDSDGNFFGSQCGSGQVVDAINADGSYTCVSVSTESGGAEGLNATLAVGDIANTTIKMNGNDIDSIGTLNSGGDTVSTGGDISAGGKVQTETVSSTNRMCLGDRC